MEKIKSLLKPGAKEEDAALYGSEAERDHAARQTSVPADGAQSSVNAQSHLNQPHEESGVLRQLGNPDHRKYNEAQYGPSGSTTAASTLPPSVSADQKLYTNPEAEQKEGGILRQILNPGGTRHDDVAYGSNATTTSPSQHQNRSDLPHGQTGISGSSLNTGDRYDETRHGMSSSHNTEGLTGSHGTTGHTSAGDRVVNTAAGPRIPGSSITAPGVASAAVNDGTTADSSLAADHIGDRNRLTGGIGSSHHHDTSMRSVDTAAGSRIPGSSVTAPGMASAAVNDGTTGSSLTGHNTTGSHSHLGRDTGLAGGAGAAGLAGLEASRHTGNATLQRPTVSNDNASTASIKSGIVGAPQSSSVGGGEYTNFSRPTGATGSHQQGDLPHVPSTGGEFMSGNNSGLTSGTTGHHSSTGLTGSHGSSGLTGSHGSTGLTGHHGSSGLGGNDSRAGLAGAAGGALDSESRYRQSVEDGWQPHEHQGHGHKYDGPNIGRDPTPVAGDSQGPHVTRIANLLDPHVGDRDSSTTGTHGLGSSHNTHDSHLGRDAALAGGAGSALGHGHSSTGTGPAPNTVGPHSADWKNVLDPRVTPNMSQQTSGTTGRSGETSDGRGVSHATGDSKVPAGIQRAVPEGLERALPDSIHDTSGSHRGAGTAAGAGAAGLAAGSAAGHHHDGTAPGSHTALPHREFQLGTTNDPATQHGVGRDHTTHRDDHSHTGATTGAGVGAAGLAAGSAAHHHHNTTSGTTTGTSPVVGERGIKSNSANPYSSSALDPRVDGGSLGSSTHGTHTGQSSDGRGVSHATGDSKVPAGIQRAVPESLERTLPDSIHDTSGSHRGAGTAAGVGAAGLAGSSATHGSSTTHGHPSGTSTLPHRDFNLGTTNDPATQHGVGRDHVGGTTAGSSTTAGSTTHTGKSSPSQNPTSNATHQETDDKHRHFGVPHRHPHEHKQPTPRDTPSIFAHDVRESQPPKFGDERRGIDPLDYSAQGGAQEHRGLGEHFTSRDSASGVKKSTSTSATAGHDTASGNTGGSSGGAANISSSSHADSEHHEKKQGFISKLLHRHKDDDVATGEHNKLHKEQH